MSTAPKLPPRLLALSPGNLAPRASAQLPRAVRAAVAAGLEGVLLREPALEDGEYLALARALREELGEGGWLGIHDRVHLAAACGADGVHLGFRSLAPEPALRVLEAQPGPPRALGVSTHAGDEAEAWRWAHYRFLGPVFDTPSKRGLLEPLGLEAFQREAASDGCPVWAIGGLDEERVAAVLAAGAAGAAVLRGILAAPDPAARTRAYLAALGGGAA